MKKVVIIFFVIVSTGYGIIIFGDRLFSPPVVVRPAVENSVIDVVHNEILNDQEVENNYIETSLETKINEETHTRLMVNENDYVVEQLRDGTLAITNYYGSGTHIAFPAKLFGIDVSEIRLSRLENRNLNSFIIENGIRKIESNSFNNLSPTIFDFNNIVLPNSILEIGNRAFFMSLSPNTKNNVQLPNRLRRIGYEAFAGQYLEINHVKSIILPKSLEYVDFRAFAELTIDYVRIENEFGVDTSSEKDLLVIISGLYNGTHHVFSNSKIRCIEICANLSETWLNYVFNDRGFINYYLSQNRRSGIYIYNGRLWTVGTRQDVNNILAGNDNFNASQTVAPKPSYSGTTRDPEFQQTWEEANKDIHTLGLPSGLMLPGGETVGEYVRSGQDSGR